MDESLRLEQERLEQVVGAMVAELPRAADAPESTVSFENNSWVLRDLQYGVADDHGLLLDAHLPADDQVHPALIFIHGGGWCSGDKSGGYRYVRGDELIADGIAVISMTYRLSDVAKYPAAVDDCLTAVRWLRAHAAALRINPDRLAAWGSSAGAHLSLMVGFLDTGPQDLDAQGNQLRNLVRCIINQYAPTELAVDDMYATPEVLRFIGIPRDEAPEVYAEASPVTHVSPGDPPVLIMHGTADRTVPYTQCERLVAKLEEAGVCYELQTYEGAGHGLEDAPPGELEAGTDRAIEFLKGCLFEE